MTVGFIEELRFLSLINKTKAECNLKIGATEVSITIYNDVMSIFHQGELIWMEKLGKDVSNFGLESCQQIHTIINNKLSGSPYKNLIYTE